MSEPYLTMAEIEKLYPNEWVLIDKPTNDRRTGQVSGGYVVMHSPDRGEIDRWILALHDDELLVAAFFYTGQPLTLDEVADLPEFKQAQ